MVSEKTKRKRLTKDDLESLRKKKLYHDLIPLAKSFGVWMGLVVIVAWDYTKYRLFSMVFVHFTTYLTYGLCKLLFIPVQLTGSTTSMVTTLEVNYDSIVVNGFSMLIELECSAYHAYLAIVALVLFSNWTLKRKLVFGSLIFAILAVINSLRIVLLGVIGKGFPDVFNIMHDYIWNILIVIILWGIWEVANTRLKQKK